MSYDLKGANLGAKSWPGRQKWALNCAHMSVAVH